ncbi:MAG: hypothetical protein KDI98_07580 [Hyphomicrobiaceae bacterium]|nr:hypothetical protein [Hyphomicrobiaceae bacterium]
MADEPQNFLEGLSGELDTLIPAAERFGTALTRALANAAIRGDDLDRSLKRIALSLSNQALSQALAPIQQAVGGITGGIAEQAVGLVGGLASSLAGGVVQSVSPTVNVSIATPDVASFRQAEAQVTSTLARAVLRGQRGL